VKVLDFPLRVDENIALAVVTALRKRPQDPFELCEEGRKLVDDDVG
jgi:hypothetical protein